MKRNYMFSEESIHKFKFCPYCGGKIMQVYDGDYTGQVECFDCEKCEEELQFDILEEMITRFPSYWESKRGQ